jgi:protein-tyrosine phosphatase
MNDIHSHILPGVDDGPKSWEGSLKMLEVAAKDGIKSIAATSHVIPGLYPNTKDSIVSLIEELRLRAAHIPIKIVPGSELQVSSDTIDGLKTGRYATLNGSRYALIELPAHFQPKSVFDFIFSLSSSGFVAILAHPERNAKYQSDKELPYTLAGMGCLTQITAGSLEGIFGSGVKKAALDMLEKNLVNIIASDAHDPVSRPPIISEGVREAQRLIGSRAVLSLADDIPGLVLDDKKVDILEPERPKARRFFFFKS